MSRAQAAILLVAAAFLVLVVVVFRQGGAADEKRPAPEFRLPRSDGSLRSLSDLRGQVVLVNFWATWCPPCVAETPSLEALHRRLKARGLAILGVSVDQGWEVVGAFVSRLGVSYEVLLDPAGLTPRRYGTLKYPETYLVDRQGTIVRKFVGEVDWSRPEVVAEIEAALGPAAR